MIVDIVIDSLWCIYVGWVFALLLLWIWTCLMLYAVGSVE